MTSTKCRKPVLVIPAKGRMPTTYSLCSWITNAACGAKGTDILGGGNQESSELHDVFAVRGLVTSGHSADVDPVAPVFIYAGQKTQGTAGATPTATP